MRIVVEEGAYTPVRAHKTDAGLDLRTPYSFRMLHGTSAVVDTGVHIEIPKGYYGKLESKSGLNVNHSIVSLGGTIDEGYTGSIKVKLYNLGEDYTFKEGDKIVQFILQPYIAPELEIVDKLDDTERGSDGFGSSGR